MLLVGAHTTVTERDLPGTQGRMLVAMLALERRPLPRDLIAEWLWPAGAAGGWQRALNPLVSKLRGQLERIDASGGCSIRTASGCVELVIPPDAWVDIEDAVTRLDRAEGALRRGDETAAWSDATVAVSILRRGLLPGCTGSWIDKTRADLHDRLVRAWLVVGTAWLARGDHALARSAASSAIEADPYSEEAHRLLIRAELAAGNRGRAAQAAERCRRMLHEELGVAPSAETDALVATISSSVVD